MIAPERLAFGRAITHRQRGQALLLRAREKSRDHALILILAVLFAALVSELASRVLLDERMLAMLGIG